MYNIILKDPKAPYYENIRFSYISPEKISSVRAFLPEQNTAIIFENLCFTPDHIQIKLTNQNISCIFVAQKYHKISTFKRENASYLIICNSGSSHKAISKIIRCYTDDVKNTSMVINSYLQKGEFVVFNFTRPEDDPLAICLRFDTSLNLQKEIKARQKYKEKSASANK